MKPLKLEAEIAEDRRLTIQLPADVKSGKHQVVVVMQSQDKSGEPVERYHYLNELVGQVKSFAGLEAMA